MASTTSKPKSKYPLRFGQEPVPLSLLPSIFSGTKLRLEDLLSVEQIRQTQAFYTSCIDGGDFDRLSEVFVPDVIADLAVPPMNNLTPLSALQSALQKAIDHTRRQHMISSQSIRIDGDTAFSVSYIYASHWAAESSQVVSYSDGVVAACGQHQDH